MADQPTHLYHGTTGAVAHRALKEGLLPRGMTGAAGHWVHTVDSSLETVHLTVAYAPYFAHAAQPADVAVDDQQWAVIEIDVSKLDTGCLMPDEDFLEQGTRGQEVPAWCKGLEDCHGMNARTEWFRDRLRAFASHWPDSIKSLGTAAHRGPIDPSAISRIGIYTPHKDSGIVTLSALDPAIMILNYLIMGPRYRAITRWFVGEELTPGEFYGLGWPAMRDRIPAEQLDRLQRVLKEHPGLEVIG